MYILAEDYSAAVQISPLELGLHASYYHKINENQAIGVELEGRSAASECTSTLAYSFDIPGAECTVKGILFHAGCLFLLIHCLSCVSVISQFGYVIWSSVGGEVLVLIPIINLPINNRLCLQQLPIYNEIIIAVNSDDQ